MAAENKQGALGHSIGDIVRDHSRGTIAEVREISEAEETLTLCRPAGYSWRADARQCTPADSKGMQDWDLAVRAVVKMRSEDAVKPVPGCARCGELNLERERIIVRRQSTVAVYEAMAGHRSDAHSHLTVARRDA
ncbi:hypothetical protein ACFQ7F_44845 [Streptomyces sp. NPDC056486]|uniref:hypothetical protein n=1 Tax=Streptomyces sp. NPDC056486 TaxID=3345835 RepID=UPI0036968C2E